MVEESQCAMSRARRHASKIDALTRRAGSNGRRVNFGFDFRSSSIQRRNEEHARVPQPWERFFFFWLRLQPPTSKLELGTEPPKQWSVSTLRL